MEGMILALVAVVVPVLALIIERTGDVRLSERHHRHHDTYLVPTPFTRSLVLATAFMGGLGLFVSGLCVQGFIPSSPLVAILFFDSFVAACFVAWWCSCRYKVSVFSDSMIVTPLFGHAVWVRYDEIERMEWVGLRNSSGYRDLVVWVGGRRAVTLRSIVDLEPILMRINRFDVLPNQA